MVELEFDIEVYQGPLELLLYLIKKNEVDLKDIPIADITAQYMVMLEKLSENDIEVTGEFLIMAAKLIHWKTLYLLPVEKDNIDEENPSVQLANLIREYEKFKAAAHILSEKNRERANLYARVDSIAPKTFQNVEEEFSVDLYKMLEAFTRVMDHIDKKPFQNIRPDEVKVEDKMEWILASLEQKDFLRFNDCFGSNNRLELVAVFLAILELVRLKKIKASQPGPFEEIRIYLNRDECECKPPHQI